MFYSETLLSKTGPLARVWLAANLERKLSKNNVLQSNIESSVSAIVDERQAPMALRLSGQLLLGVVRIYSRKARYLLDDCNEALMKIKMAFRPGNVDLPANHSHAVNPASLTLPDVLTELDLLAPLPDPSLLFSQPLDLDLPDQDITLNSQMLSGSIEQPRAAPDDSFRLEEVEDLILDVSEGPELSIEVPRDAPPPRAASEEFGASTKALDDDGVFLDIGEDAEPTMINPLSGDLPMDHDDDDIEMGDVEVEAPAQGEEDVFAPPPVDARKERDTLSPLSSIRSSVERDMERSFQPDQSTTIFEPTEEEITVQQPHKVKRRKVLHADTDTELRLSDIRAQQNDRSSILKPASFLPKDPLLLALMTMQKSGGFVSSILGDGRSQGWAPELRGILSLEVVRRSGDLKRKRDSGVADLEEEGDTTQSQPPQLEIEQEEELVADAPIDFGGDTTLGGVGMQMDDEEIPAPGIDEQDEIRSQASIEEPLSPVPDNFDDTTAPLLHPSESGPVSLGTKHAVHILRDRFGPAAADSAAERQKTSVLFQDMLPESTTTKADATKMFFEVLVLATKDAIKVEQPSNVLGGPIRIRGKRGLWGAWAETQAGGEIASQTIAPVTTTA